MIARGKRRFAAAVQVVFTAWPLAHYALVQAYGLNPWKFGGWAMYTVTTYWPEVEVSAIRGDEREILGIGGTAFPASFAARKQLVFDAGIYGELADPRPLARAAAAESGGDASIEVVITQAFIDRKSARVHTTSRSFFYEAPR